MLDLGARPFAEQDAIAGLHVERDELAALVARAGPGGDDLALLRLLLGGIGNDDAALRLLLGVDAADDDAVVQAGEISWGFPSARSCARHYMFSWHSYCKSAKDK